MGFRLRKKSTVDSKKLEQGCGTMHAGWPSFFGLGLEDGSSSNFLASTVKHLGIFGVVRGALT